MNRKNLIFAGSLLVLLLLAIVFMTMPAQNLQAQAGRTATPAGTFTPGPSPTFGGPTETPEGLFLPPSRTTDLAPQVSADKKITVVIRHKDGSYENILIPPEKYNESFIQSLPAGDIVVRWIPPQPLKKNPPPNAGETPGSNLPSVMPPTALTSSSCTQNPSGLSISISQQAGKNLPLPTSSNVTGPIHSFYVQGTGFTPGEKVTVVIKGRVTAPGTMGSTDETVEKDSTFATTLAVAVSQPNMPFDLFVIHRRGIACASLTAVQ